MPVGPIETGPLWYARSRLAFVCFGLFAWGAGFGAEGKEGKWFLLFTRVMEKPSELTICLLQHVISLLPPAADRRELVYWCDCGPHFRTYRVMGTIATDIMQDTRLNQCINFGMEQHFKNVCDGKFGRISEHLREASTKEVLGDLSDVVRVLKRAHEVSVEIDKERGAEARPPEHFEEWLPPPRDSVRTHEILGSSLPVPISASHLWSFRWTDMRRRCLIGMDGSTLTGVVCTAGMISGPRPLPAQSCTPKLKLREADEGGPKGEALGPGEAAAPGDALGPAEAAAPEEAAAPGEHDDDAPDDLPAVNTKVWHGWRLSYRTDEPEKTPAEVFVKRVARKRAAFRYQREAIGEAASSRSPAAMQAAADRRATARRLKRI